MIKLFYTGASQWKGDQNLAAKSLGGFISKTTVPNKLNNSLFGDLGEDNFWDRKNSEDFVGLGLYIFFFEGEQEYDKANLIFNLDYNIQSNYGNYNQDIESLEEIFKEAVKFKVGLGPIAGNDSDGYYLEQIPSRNSCPFYYLKEMTPLVKGENLVFNDITTKGVGLWLSRELNPDFFRKTFDCQSEYWEKYNNLPNVSYNFEIKINLTFPE